MMGNGRRRDQAVQYREFLALSLGSPQEPSPGCGHFPIDGQRAPFKPRHEIIADPGLQFQFPGAFREFFTDPFLQFADRQDAQVERGFILAFQPKQDLRVGFFFN